MARQRAAAARRRRKIQVSEMAFAYLSDDPDYKSRDGNCLEMLDLRYPGTGERKMETLRTMWDAVRAEIMGTWTQERPGTRPRAWWRLDAPRWDDPWDGRYYHGTLAEPRRRLGGKGTPMFECLGYFPQFEFGIPADFITASTLAVYDKTGGLENGDRPGEPVEAFDPEDPPTFESQAKYLWDRDLLEPEERKIVERLGLLDEVETVERQDEKDELGFVTRREASKPAAASRSASPDVRGELNAENATHPEN